MWTTAYAILFIFIFELGGSFFSRSTLRLFELALVLVRLDHVALTDLTHSRIFPRNVAPDFTHYFSERPEMSSYNMKPIADLRQQIHDDLRRQHPEWVLPNGESPMCDVYDARLMDLLALVPGSYLRSEWQRFGN